MIAEIKWPASLPRKPPGPKSQWKQWPASLPSATMGAGMEPAIYSRVLLHTIFQSIKINNQCLNICHAFGAKKKAPVLSNCLLFQSFKINNQSDYICHAFGAKKKGLVLSDFLLVQSFKLPYQSFKMRQVNFCSGTSYLLPVSYRCWLHPCTHTHTHTN